MECWGAQGGNANSYNAGNGPIVYGGKGAYVCGTINLTSEAIFYIFVGGKGNDGGKIGILIPTGGGMAVAMALWVMMMMNKQVVLAVVPQTLE